MAFLTSHASHTSHTSETSHTSHADYVSYSALDASPLLAEGLISSQRGLNHWVLDGQRRPLMANPMGAVRTGFGGANLLNTDALARFFGMEAGPRSYVCHAELMGQVDVRFNGADLPVDLVHRPTARTIVTLQRPDYGLFRRHLELVHQLSKERPDRYAEILPQVYPAHAWWSEATGLRPDRHRMTMEFLDAALNFTVSTVFRFKQLFACPRPYEYSPDIQPLILTPGHDSWPSGHATESFVTARLLETLARQDPSRAPVQGPLMDTAARIAENREVAGLHFPADSAAGRVLGDTLARFVLWHSTGDAALSGMRSRQFIAKDFYTPNQDALPPLPNAANFDSTFFAGAPWPDEAAPDLPAQPYMRWLWGRASAEWAK